MISLQLWYNIGRHGGCVKILLGRHLVGEWFVDEASDAAAVHRDPDHHRHVLRQVLSVLLGRVCTQKIFFL